jgi:hypothetical protein
LRLLVVPVVFTYLAGLERRLLGHGVKTTHGAAESHGTEVQAPGAADHALKPSHGS